MEDYSVKDEYVQAGEAEQGETCGGRQHPKESPCGCNAESKEENGTTLGMRNRREQNRLERAWRKGPVRNYDSQEALGRRM